MMKKNKKGQIDMNAIMSGGLAFSIGLLILVVVAFLGATVIESVRTNNIVETQTTVTNETLTMSASGQFGEGFGGNTSVTIDQAQVHKGIVNSTVIFTNTTETLVAGIDYVDNDTAIGSYTIVTNYSEAPLNITYDFLSDIENAPTNVTQNGLVGLFNFSGQFGNVGTIGAIVLVIVLIIGGLGAFLGTKFGR